MVYSFRIHIKPLSDSQADKNTGTHKLSGGNDFRITEMEGDKSH